MTGPGGFSVNTVRRNPASLGAVTGRATYTSFWSSLLGESCMVSKNFLKDPDGSQLPYLQMMIEIVEMIHEVWKQTSSKGDKYEKCVWTWNLCFFSDLADSVTSLQSQAII